jgi:hypothetical protein
MSLEDYSNINLVNKIYEINLSLKRELFIKKKTYNLI